MKNLREFYIRAKVFKLVRHKGVYSYELWIAGRNLEIKTTNKNYILY